MSSRPPVSHRCELLSIQLRSVDDQSAVVRPRGELDSLTSPLLAQVLDHQLGRHSRVVLDLAEVWRLSWCGLRVLHRARQHARRRGARFEVVAAHDHIAHQVCEFVDSEVPNGADAPVGGRPGPRLPEPRMARVNS